jgi:hypothetical protein
MQLKSPRGLKNVCLVHRVCVLSGMASGRLDIPNSFHYGPRIDQLQNLVTVP